MFLHRLLHRNKTELGMLPCTCNPSTWEPEGVGLEVSKTTRTINLLGARKRIIIDSLVEFLIKSKLKVI